MDAIHLVPSISVGGKLLSIQEKGGLIFGKHNSSNRVKIFQQIWECIIKMSERSYLIKANLFWLFQSSVDTLCTRHRSTGGPWNNQLIVKNFSFPPTWQFFLLVVSAPGLPGGHHRLARWAAWGWGSHHLGQGYYLRVLARDCATVYNLTSKYSWRQALCL